MTFLPKHAAAAVVLALTIALAGSATLIQRTGDPDAGTERYDALPFVPPTEPPVTAAPEPAVGPDGMLDPSATLLPGTSNEDLARLLNGGLPDRIDSRPRLKCEDPLTIAAGDSGTASCVFYPDAFRGPLTIVGCGESFVCYPAQKGPIEITSDREKHLDVVFDVPATETRSRFTVTIEIYAFGDFYFPVEIIVPQAPASG